MIHDTMRQTTKIITTLSYLKKVIMEIISDKLYSITDTSVILDMHPRTLQRRAKSMGARMIDGRYLFSGHQIEKLILDDTTTTRHTTGIATPEELSDTNTINVNVDALNILKKRLKEFTQVGFQKEQVQYLRGRVEKQDDILKQLQETIRERNFIEAKDKGYHKK